MTASLLLFAALCAAPAPKRIEVAVLLGTDARSRLFAADLSHGYGERTPYEKRLKELKAEVDAVADVKLLDPLTPGLSQIQRPALRIGHRDWESVGDLKQYDRGGGVLWLRHTLDPWIVDAKYERAMAAYQRERGVVAARRAEIQERFCTAHGFRAAYLGQLDTRTVRDPVTGLLCITEPLLPPYPEEPEPPAPFEFGGWSWLPVTYREPVEAKRP